MKKSLWLLILLMVLMGSLLLLTACSSGTDTSTETATEIAADANLITTEANPTPHQPVIGMVIKYASTEYIQAFVKGAQDTCDELGIKLLITDAEADSLKIMNAIDSYMVQGIDGFILAGAEDLKTLVPGIQALNEAKVPVMALDTCPEGGHVDMFLTFDLADSSSKAAEQMIAGIKEKNGGEVPTGVVIEITGALVDMFTSECHKGFESVMKNYPQLTVVQGEGNWNNQDSYNRASDLMTKYGDQVVGIYVHTPDIMGSGVVSAVENAGKNPADYFISGICIGKEGIELIKQDKLYSVVEQPAMDSAILAVKYLNMMLHGEAIPQVGDTITEEGALWSPALVIENEFADSGATMILQGPLVPQQVDPTDPGLWENIL